MRKLVALAVALVALTAFIPAVYRRRNRPSGDLL